MTARACTRELGRGAYREFSRSADVQGTRLQGRRILYLGSAVRAERAARADYDAAARGDGAGGEKSRGDQNLPNRGKSGRLYGRPGIFEVRRGRQHPAHRGGKENRQGRVGRSGSG